MTVATHAKLAVLALASLLLTACGKKPVVTVPCDDVTIRLDVAH